MASITLTAATFKEAISADGITFVDWWASWCNPCQQFAPVYEDASDKHTDLVFGSVSTEEEQGLAAAAGISSIPALMAFRDGVLVYSKTGVLNEADLEAVIASVRDLDMADVRRQIAQHKDSHR